MADNRHEDLLDVAIAWSSTGDAELLYTACVEDKQYTVRLNDFPAEPLYTLMLGNEELFHIDDWPGAWIRPAPPKAPDADALKRAFDAHFASQGLSFPDDCLRRASGEFSCNGSKVDFRFGMTSYAAHLDLVMTEGATTNRYRVHADGRVDSLGTL